MKRLSLLFLCLALLAGCTLAPITDTGAPQVTAEYQAVPYIQLEDNIPDFSDDDLCTEAFETYSPLDALGRCGVAFANICKELMPTEPRGEIGMVKPSGWHTVRYDGLVDGNYLYNRCHLIGFQLAGENANALNLITGTRYMNVEGMLPFENQVADYVEETGNHVLYRVSPIFQGEELVARGVQMEAQSVEDGGAGICFNVYVFNVQPGVKIDYSTGESWLAGEVPGPSAGTTEGVFTYVLNRASGKFHDPGCAGVATMKEENKMLFNGSRDELIEMGYSPCGQCSP